MTFEPRFPQYEKRPYCQVFVVPGPNWKVEAVWEDAYYQSAKRLLEGVARGEFLPAFEGVVGLYLFRHYLELAIKFIIFHSRWLKDAQTNAKLEEIAEVKKTHSLSQLWTLAKAECQRVIPATEWGSIDIAFVDRCVHDIDSIDPNGELFRYHGPRFGVEKDPIVSGHKSNNDSWLPSSIASNWEPMSKTAMEMGVFSKSVTLKICRSL